MHNNEVQTAKHWGAYKAEWDYVKNSPELVQYIIPIVSNKNLLPPPLPNKKDIRGKAPSVKNWEGRAFYMKEWQRHNTTEEELNTWASDTDLGFGFVTGRDGVIAIDCDCDDRSVAYDVLKVFSGLLGVAPKDIPIRTRGGARWAALVKVPELVGQIINKIILKIDDNNTIELRGSNSQLACCGTHPSGERYTWSKSPFPLVRLSQDKLKQLQDSLTAAYQCEIITEHSKERKKGQTFTADDRLGQWLCDNWQVLDTGKDGELFIQCPWGEEHTGGIEGSSVKDTVYFPIGSNGYEQGGFKCLHAHCVNRTLNDLLSWAKSQGYQETSAEDFPDESANNGNNGHSNGYYYALGRLNKWYSEKTGEYDVTPDSVSTALSYPEFCGYYIRYDTFFGKILVKPSGDSSADWEVCADKDNLALRLALERRGFKPRQLGKELIKDAVNYVAQNNTADYMEDYIKNKLPKWDGVQRAERFLIDYCGAEDTEYSRALGRYFWGLAWRRAADRQPIKADISLILIGAQGAKKSTFVKTLAMEDRFYIDLDFKNKSDEIALRIGGRIIAEVPEMNGFQQRANSELKAFLSMSEDTYRVMYSQDQRTVTRRNMLIITENRRYILSDTTGNRRYAPIEVSKFDSEKIKDVVPLLWAEGAEIFKKYGGEKLHTDVEEITAERNDKYMIGDVWEETISEYIENQSSLSDSERLPLTSGNIMRYGLKLDAGASSNPAICRRFNAVMESLGYAKKQRRVKAKGEGSRVRDWVKIEE